MSRDLIDNTEISKVLIYRHFAWLTALRYEMRSYRVWENIERKHNAEYQQYYVIPERKHTIERSYLIFFLQMNQTIF
jgi:putative membrane protein